MRITTTIIAIAVCGSATAEEPPQKSVLDDYQPQWELHTEISDFDGETTKYITMKSTNLIECPSKHPPEPASIYIGCSGVEPIFYIETPHCFLSDIGQYGRVDFKTPQEEVFDFSLSGTRDNHMLGERGGKLPIHLAKRFLGTSELTIRFTPYREQPVTATFDMTGYTDATKPIQAACNW